LNNVKSVIPDTWNTNKDIRKKIGDVLAWKHIKVRTQQYEEKSCIGIRIEPDSLGRYYYIVSEIYSNKDPFDTWIYQYTYYDNYYIDTVTKIKTKDWDLNIKAYNHKPSEAELYALLQKWQFHLSEIDPNTIEAGLNDNLWKSTFGFLPNRKILVQSK
jgi:hypothetical protein